MRNLFLSLVLITAPVLVFAAGYNTVTPSMAGFAAQALGDMGPFSTITTNVQMLVATGDLAAATLRIKDLETAWADAQSTRCGRWTLGLGTILTSALFLTAILAIVIYMSTTRPSQRPVLPQ